MNYLLFLGLFLIPLLLVWLKTYVDTGDKWFFTLTSSILFLVFSLVLFNTESITYVSGANVTTAYSYDGSNLNTSLQVVDYLESDVPAINEPSIAFLFLLFSFGLAGMAYNEFFYKRLGD